MRGRSAGLAHETHSPTKTLQDTRYSQFHLSPLQQTDSRNDEHLIEVLMHIPRLAKA
ncbi:MAG: hypothetical protein ACO3XO_04575 [Bdellovibrionota bacterium]